MKRCVQKMGLGVRSLAVLAVRLVQLVGLGAQKVGLGA